MSDWKDVVRTVAPALGTALGGPLAGVATRYIANEFLGDGEANEEEIAAALQGATPDDLARLKQLDRDFQVEMEKLLMQDRADARERDVQLVTQRGHNYRADILAFLAVCGLVFCVWTVANDPALPSGVREVIMFVAGTFATAMRDVYAFEFGSSRGSKDKDAIIGRLR